MNSSIRLIFALFILLGLSSTACKSSGGEENAEGTVIDESQRILSKEDFAAAITKRGAVVVDLRNPFEYEQSHIGDAINIDFFDGQFKNNILDLDREKKYYLYDKNESSAYRGMKFMETNGFTQVYILKGGYKEWNTARDEPVSQ